MEKFVQLIHVTPFWDVNTRQEPARMETFVPWMIVPRPELGVSTLLSSELEIAADIPQLVVIATSVPPTRVSTRLPSVWEMPHA